MFHVDHPADQRHPGEQRLGTRRRVERRGELEGIHRPQPFLRRAQRPIRDVRAQQTFRGLQPGTELASGPL